MDSDLLTFITLSDSIAEKYNEDKLWQHKLIEALCRVNRKRARG